MRKIPVGLLASALALALLVPSGFGIAGKDDNQVIKKAVKRNPDFESSREIKWLKILVKDAGRSRTKIRLTLPVSLIDASFKKSKRKKLKVHSDHYEIDIRELYEELKKRGPATLLELSSRDEIVKIWLE